MPPYYSIMRTFALLMLAFASLHADDGAEARYVGGTSATIKSDADGKLSATDDLFLQYRCKGKELHVQYTNINLIEYGQNVDRRYIMAALVSPLFILSKKRQHFLTLGYTDTEQRQQAMVFKVDKKKIRALLVSLGPDSGGRTVGPCRSGRTAGLLTTSTSSARDGPEQPSSRGRHFGLMTTA